MKKAMVFSYEEFDNIVYEATYRTMGIYYNKLNEVWCFTEVTEDSDEWWDEWLEEFGKDVEEEVNSFGADDDGFVYAMIGKRFDAVVDEVIIDFFNERVAVIFE